MKIIIDYEASWRNSFLDRSNNEPKQKNRKFVGSIASLAKKENYLKRDITIDTILGVLNRLIGEQRKLYQSKNGFGGYRHYFEDILNAIHFKDHPTVINQEITYLRNMSGNTDQNSFTGMIKAKDIAFQSEFSSLFWGVLSLNLENLYKFIINDSVTPFFVNPNPISILSRLEQIKKMRTVDNNGMAYSAYEKLRLQYENFNPLDSKGQLKILPMYCSSLYLQLDRLEKNFDVSGLKTKMGKISGISNNGFTVKDFMDRYTTGTKKIVYGNPYIQDEYIKGEGKVRNCLKKTSGQLEIILDIALEKAMDLKIMIENAGVSSFYLGKKGLAYVSRIDVR